MIQVCSASVVFTFKKCREAVHENSTVTVYDKGGTKVALFKNFDWAKKGY